VEHRLQEVVPAANKLLIMDRGGRLLHYGKPREVCAQLAERPDLLMAMPSTVRLFSSMKGFGQAESAELRGSAGTECPLTISEGRQWIAGFGCEKKPVFEAARESSAPYALEMDDVWFRYERNGHDILRGTTLSVHEGEIFCILGGNGSGKTTCLGAVAGLNKPYSGKVRIFGKDIKEYKNQSLYRNCLTMLPQDVQTIFLKNTVREELADAGEAAKQLPYDIESLMDKHPYDLSGGEQQLVALAKVLATDPRLLLLAEPTTGIDASAAARIVDILKKLRDGGMTIVIVTHDVEFAAMAADRCAMFFRGEVTSTGAPREFFSENNFYTTAVNRLTRGYFHGCITHDDAINALKLQAL
jgi:energy-coupling factor transport system ATP-binding protein